jgi:hypothetical protein
LFQKLPLKVKKRQNLAPSTYVTTSFLIVCTYVGTLIIFFDNLIELNRHLLYIPTYVMSDCKI